MNATESTVDNTVVNSTEVAAPKRLSPEEKAKREASRIANEALINTVRVEAEAMVMTQYGFPGAQMSDMLRAQASTQAAIRKAAKDILKGSAPAATRNTTGTLEKEKDAQRCKDQLIRSLEFADRNGLLKHNEGEDSIFISLLKEVFECEVAVGTFDSFVAPVKEAKPEVAADGEPEVAAE